MKTMRAFVAVAVAVTASVARISGAEPAMADGTLIPTIGVRLLTGSTLFGKPVATQLLFATKYAELPVAWSAVRSIEGAGTSGVWRLRLDDGNVMMGRMRGTGITIAGALGIREVRLDTVVDLTSTSADASLPSGMVLHFPFDEPSGERAGDASGNGMDGTVHGAEWSSVGRWGGALQFMGFSDRGSVVRVPNAPRLNSPCKTDQLTISCWIKPLSTPSEFPVLVCKGGNQPPRAFGGYELYLYANGPGQLHFASGKTSAGATRNPKAAVSADGWTHVVCTVDGRSRQVVMYSDGLPMSATAASVIPAFGGTILQEVPNDLFIGGPDPGHHQNRAWFDGLIDELMIFDRVLRADEVETLSRVGPGSAHPFGSPPPDAVIETVLDLSDNSRLVGRCLDGQLAVEVLDLGPACIPQHLLATVEPSTNQAGHLVRLHTGDRLEVRVTADQTAIEGLLGRQQVPWRYIRRASFHAKAASLPESAAREGRPSADAEGSSPGSSRSAGRGAPLPSAPPATRRGDSP